MRIRFPIGDWSDDGHGQCDYYFANTDKNTQDVRGYILNVKKFWF